MTDLLPGNEARRPARLLVTLATAVLAALACVGAGCGGGAGAGGGFTHASADIDLRGVPLSPELRPWVEAFVGPEATAPPAARQHEVRTYTRLQAAIENPDQRDAAGDSLYALWRADPENFLWINGAIVSNYLLRRTADRNEMFARPALADTAAAVGAFVHARRFYRYSEGPEAYGRVEARAAELDSLQRSWLTLRLAVVDSDTGNHLGAVSRLLDGMDLARRAGGEAMAEYYWQGVARYLWRADRLDDALHAAAVAVALSSSAGDQDRRLAGLQMAADIRGARHEIAGATALYDQVHAEALAAGKLTRAYTVLDRAAALCSEQMDYAGALAHDRRAVALALAAGDSLNVPAGMMNIADDFRGLGELDSSRVAMLEAQRWVEAFGDRRSLARLPVLMAEYAMHVGDYDTADSLLAVARDRLPESAGAELEGEILMGLLRQGMATGRAAPAYRAMARLESVQGGLYDVAPHENAAVDIALAVAEFLTVQQDLRGAAAAVEQARGDLGRGDGAVDTERAWHWTRTAGALAMARGDLAGAERLFRDALPTLQGDPSGLLGACRLHLAEVLLAAGRAAEADSLLRPLVAAGAFGGGFRGRLEALCRLATCARVQGDPDGAGRWLARADSLLAPHSPRDVVAEIRLEHALVLAAGHEHDQALAQLALAGAVLDEGQAGLRALDDPGRFLGDLRRRLVEARVACVVAEEALPVRGEVARRSLEAAAGLAFGDLGDRRPEKGVSLLVFLVGDQRSYAWFADAGGVTVHDLPPAPALRDGLTPLLADLEHPGRPLDASQPEAVGQMLLAPAAAAVARGDRLVIVSDGILNLAPWYALVPPGGDRPLLDLVTVVEAPDVAAALTVSGDGRGATARPLLALGFDGDAGADRPGAPPALRFAEKEAAAVARAWAPAGAGLRVGEQARWDRVAPDLGAYGAIHLATHAMARSSGPLRASLVLAGSPQPVTADLLRQCRLDADLVYLSCCDAASGHRGGGAVRDLAGAFLLAGSRNVIASSRRMNDEAALLLAEAFYRHWREDEDVAAAMRAALRDLRADHKWTHAAHWGSVRLITTGDAG